MSGYKEFEGKTLDDAIDDACSFYDTPREKLEIDILNDAKGGIFGLVGTKKARINARIVHFPSILEGLDATPAQEKQPSKRVESVADEARPQGRRQHQDDAPRKDRGRQGKKRAPIGGNVASEASREGGVDSVPSGDVFVEGNDSTLETNAKFNHDPPAAEGCQRQNRNGNSAKLRAPHPKLQESATPNGLDDMDMDTEGLKRVSFEQLDANELESVAKEIVARLTQPFLGETTIAVTISNDRVRVSITDVEDPGLLIGRDGQTLASLQYLVTRMVSNRMKALLRVQIDAGDYRERQDERLREMALNLAEKVKAGGRPQVTRPLSSYHRRVIHLTLEGDPLIQTHSKGEGEMKRVMVARKKGAA